MFVEKKRKNIEKKLLLSYGLRYKQKKVSPEKAHFASLFLDTNSKFSKTNKSEQVMTLIVNLP